MRIINNEMSHKNWAGVVSNDHLRPVMAGVYFDLVNEKMVATNSHLLVCAPLSIEWDKGEEDLSPEAKTKILQLASKIVPLELFDRKKYMGHSKSYIYPVHYDFSDPRYAMVFNGPEMVFRCRYIDGVFPNYEGVILKEQESMDEIKINFSMLKNIQESIPYENKNLQLKFCGRNKPILFESTIDSNFHGLIMPVV